MTTKTIHIKYLVTGKQYDLTVNNDETVKNLKSRIESLLGGIKIVNKLMIKHAKRRNQKSLDNEDLTIFDAHIVNDDVITIGRSDVKGGIKFENYIKILF